MGNFSVCSFGINYSISLPRITDEINVAHLFNLSVLDLVNVACWVLGLSDYYLGLDGGTLHYDRYIFVNHYYIT